ncbi:MAG: hypothetical protein ACQ9CV_05665 [Nitrosopumilus sp.]
MNRLVLISILAGIIITISSSALLLNVPSSESESRLIYDAGFTYYDIEIIQDRLNEQNIFVSSPTAVTDHTINQYCTYFEKGLPRTVEYCTTTAVLDYEGTALGNINIGGDIDLPILAIANIETSSLESNQEEVFTIFETVIESLVCECWEEEKSEDYPTIRAWLVGVQTFYTDSDKRNIKSKIDNLKDHEILLEITTKDNSVLQTLVILK